jgi:SAM-dependent methyltransferase
MAADCDTGEGRLASPAGDPAAHPAVQPAVQPGAASAPGDRPPRPDIAAALAATAERYRDCGRVAHGYVCSKLRRDPVHRDLLTLAAAEPFGEVVDIGCGRGQLGIALLQAGLAASVTGMDCHAGHLAQAGQAAAGLALHTRLQDLEHGFGALDADTILAIDVLYQLDDAAQERLLQAAAQSARQRIVLRLLDPQRGVRSRLTVGLERLFRGLSPHAGRWVNPWPLARFAAIIEPHGYDIGVTPCWRGTPFANVLLIARRRR